MPEQQASRPPVNGRPPPDITELADALVRRLFAVSLNLHQALARLSALDGDHRLPTQHPERGGNNGRHADPVSAHRPVFHQETERACRTLRQAISELDAEIHDIRALVAHTITPVDATTPGDTLSPADERPRRGRTGSASTQ